MICESMSELWVGKIFVKCGIKVIYQHPIGPYTADIYLPEYNITVEIHGPHHVMKCRILRDRQRSEYIANKGVKEFIITADEAINPGFMKQFVKGIKSNRKINTKRKTSEEPFNNQLAEQLRIFIRNNNV